MYTIGVHIQGSTRFMAGAAFLILTDLLTNLSKLVR